MEIADKCPVHRTLHLRDRHPDHGAGGRMSIVIVGAGQAAAQLVLSLRQGGCKDAIRMIGDEPYAPYQRPPLSKKFLTERPAGRNALFPPGEFLARAGCQRRIRRVGRVDRPRRQARDLRGRAGRLRYAVSRRPARGRAPFRCPASIFRGVFSLRRIDDVRRLRGPLDAAKRVVIVGGGYIGLEVAAVARGEGRAVTVLEAEDRVMKRVTSPVISTLHAGFPS